MMHDTYLWNSRHKHATAKLNEIAEWYDILLVYLGSLELDQVFQEQSDWDHRWIITTRIIKKKKNCILHISTHVAEFRFDMDRYCIEWKISLHFW